MIDKYMEYLLGECLAIDVSEFPQNDEMDYILDSYVPSCTYCDARTEKWICSIGCNTQSMRLYASTTDKFHDRPGFQCLFYNPNRKSR